LVFQFVYLMLCQLMPVCYIKPGAHNPRKGQDRKGREGDCAMLLICNHSQLARSWVFRELCIVVFVYIVQSPSLPFRSCPFPSLPWVVHQASILHGNNNKLYTIVVIYCSNKWTVILTQQLHSCLLLINNVLLILQVH
jgi:hypothetical protein